MIRTAQPFARKLEVGFVHYRNETSAIVSSIPHLTRGETFVRVCAEAAQPAPMPFARPGKAPIQPGQYTDQAIFRNESEAELHDVASRLISAREEERSRLARELHDDLGQKIALLSLELEQFRKYVADSKDLAPQFDALQDRVLEISTDIQRLSHRLHPMKLDCLGLATAVNSLCRDLNNTGKLKIEQFQEGDLGHLPKDAALCAYRIVQEALRNCTKHSGAATARVALVNNGRMLRLSVSDDGCGHDVESENDKHGLGLTSMWERVRTVGGNICIRSKPGFGTLVDVSIPLNVNS